jgi:succinate dehydrogenase hydrophobic anchor subunit
MRDLTLWRWQRYTALAAFPLVIAHVVLQYFVFGTETSTSFASVSTRMQGGLILTLDVLLLAVVSAHGFLGLRGMLQDYARSSTAAAWITRLTLGAFVLVLAYGLLALTAFLQGSVR